MSSGKIKKLGQDVEEMAWIQWHHQTFDRETAAMATTSAMMLHDLWWYW